MKLITQPGELGTSLRLTRLVSENSFLSSSIVSFCRKDPSRFGARLFHHLTLDEGVPRDGVIRIFLFSRFNDIVTTIPTMVEFSLYIYWWPVIIYCWYQTHFLKKTPTSHWKHFTMEKPPWFPFLTHQNLGKIIQQKRTEKSMPPFSR